MCSNSQAEEPWHTFRRINFTDLLLTNSIIAKSIKEKLDSFRGLRNRLVHRYGEVDDRIVYRNITENIDDFEEIRKVLKYIAEKL